MTIDMEEFETLRKKFYESFAKEYKIKLKEDDMAAPEDGGGEEAAAPAEEAPTGGQLMIEPASTDPVPAITPPADIVPGVAEDTSLQTSPIDKDGKSEIVFEKGNLDLLQTSLKALVRKPGLIIRTLLPLIEKALIEELGSSSSYRRESFNFNITLSNNQVVYSLEIVYGVDLFIGTDIDPAAIAHDQDYIKNTIGVIPGIVIKDVKIDTSNGLVSIIINV